MNTLTPTPSIDDGLILPTAIINMAYELWKGLLSDPSIDVDHPMWAHVRSTAALHPDFSAQADSIYAAEQVHTRTVDLIDNAYNEWTRYKGFKGLGSMDSKSASAKVAAVHALACLHPSYDKWRDAPRATVAHP